MPATVTAMTRTRRKPSADTPPPALPAREHLTVQEVAAALAPRLSCAPQAAERRLYRAIQSAPPTVRAVRVCGALRIPRAEAERLLAGERV